MPQKLNGRRTASKGHASSERTLNLVVLKAVTIDLQG